jgi:hypothetical protein
VYKDAGRATNAIEENSIAAIEAINRENQRRLQASFLQQFDPTLQNPDQYRERTGSP